MIAAIIRLVYMSRMIHEPDITWALGPAQIWTSLEPSLGIVSSCLITTFRPIVSGIRNIFGLKYNRKDDRVSNQYRQTIGSMAPRRAPCSKAHGVEDDEEELTLYHDVRRYKVSVTTGTTQHGVLDASQQNIEESLRQEWRELSPKGAPDDRIQVETSFVVKKG